MMTCCFSMIGAILIIMTYACCKELRSRGRQILLHISIMDFGVGLFNFCGASFHFSNFYHSIAYNNCSTFISELFIPSHFSQHHVYITSDSTILCPQSETIQSLCLSQASLSIFFTCGSILWTLSLSFYLYFRIVHKSSNLAKYTLYTSYLFCYAVPVALTIWLLLTGRLGYSPYESSGWCSIILMNPLTKNRDIYASVFGYNIWIVIMFTFAPILSFAVHLNVRAEMKHAALYRRTDEFLGALHSIDYKFLLIPLVFILLRFWSFISDVLYIFAGREVLPHQACLTLTLLGGIGDSGQGITNAILFILFTKKARDSFKTCCFCKVCLNGAKKMRIQAPTNISHVDGDEQRSLIEDSLGSSNQYCLSHSNEYATPEP